MDSCSKAELLSDSHCHLTMAHFREDLEEVLNRAHGAGVGVIVTCGIDVKDSRHSLFLAQQYPQVYCTVGVHPHKAGGLDKGGLLALKEMAANPKVVAIGEIGLDFYRNLSPRESQINAFEEQMALALELSKPIVVHSRNANKEVLDLLRPAVKGGIQGVVHCFSGDLDVAASFLDLGFFISIPGTITFREAGRLREVLACLPAERLLLETDSPYLAPEPFRGKRNEPSLIRHTAEVVARIMRTKFDKLVEITTDNLRKLFGICCTDVTRSDKDPDDQGSGLKPLASQS